VGDEIQLTLDLDNRVGQVRADAGHLTQIFMNLVTNARDAMPTGGRIRVATAPVSVERGHPNPDASPGKYTRITVSDTGQGMSAEVAARAFEPFFSTKPIGRGTGLGLAMVYGLVRQAGGFVELESATGVGTAIRVYFPHSDDRPAPQLAGLKPLPPQGECILVAEDDDRLRTAIVSLLVGAGYAVTAAASGLAALAASDRLRNRPDLLLTDVAMPGMDGRALAAEMRRRHTKLKVVFMSGYAADGIAEGTQDLQTAFLQKPFDPDTLLWFIREALDSTL
jgi:CheY-like chemotaxis protein